ncbi:hypothetical protein GCM10022630_25120 [Thermobifida alba]
MSNGPPPVPLAALPHNRCGESDRRNRSQTIGVDESPHTPLRPSPLAASHRITVPVNAEGDAHGFTEGFSRDQRPQFPA